jgi:aspartate aminotransferase/aminotransferase
VKLAERMSRIDSSGIRKVFALAAEMKNPCNLSIGQPEFAMPEEIQKAGIEAIQAGKNSYTQTGGIQALKDRILEKCSAKKGIDKDRILITSGTSGGIMLSFMALFDQGDEALVPDPYFVMYKHLLNLIGAKPVYIDLYPDFRMTADRLAEKVTERTKAILFNSPANPTGAVSSRSDMEAIARFAKERNLLIISDEIYNLFVYDEPFLSMGDLYEKTLLLGGFSKTFSMTGWRLGYALGPSDIIGAMEELQQYSFVCAPSVAQEMGLATFDVDMTPYRDSYRNKRDIIYEGLKDYYEVAKPGGAFYIFPKAPGGDGGEFCKEGIRHELLTVPGNVFSERNSHFRISFAASDETLKRGIEILRRLSG